MRTGASRVSLNSVSGRTRSWARLATRRRLRGWLVSVALVGAISGGSSCCSRTFQCRACWHSIYSRWCRSPSCGCMVRGTGVAVERGGIRTPVRTAAVFGQSRSPVGPVRTGIFLVTSVVVGELATRWRRQARNSARLTEEQAALRRVATLVARSVSPAEVFAAVTREVGLLCRADMARMERYEADGTVIGVARWGRLRDELASALSSPSRG